VIYIVLASGLLAGVTGWRHPNSETRAMSRVAAAGAALIALVLWGQW
jgi:hypothetical protein